MAGRPKIGVERVSDPHLRFLFNQVIDLIQGAYSRIETIEAAPPPAPASLPVAIQSISSYLEFRETTAPSNSPNDRAFLYAEDDGTGKTRLVVKFPSGAALVLATQP